MFSPWDEMQHQDPRLQYFYSTKMQPVPQPPPPCHICTHCWFYMAELNSSYCRFCCSSAPPTPLLQKWNLPSSPSWILCPQCRVYKLSPPWQPSNCDTCFQQQQHFLQPQQQQQQQQHSVPFLLCGLCRNNKVRPNARYCETCSASLRCARCDGPKQATQQHKFCHACFKHRPKCRCGSRIESVRTTSHQQWRPFCTKCSCILCEDNCAVLNNHGCCASCSDSFLHDENRKTTAAQLQPSSSLLCEDENNNENSCVITEEEEEKVVASALNENDKTTMLRIQPLSIRLCAQCKNKIKGGGKKKKLEVSSYCKTCQCKNKKCPNARSSDMDYCTTCLQDATRCASPNCDKRIPSFYKYCGNCYMRSQQGNVQCVRPGCQNFCSAKNNPNQLCLACNCPPLSK